MEFDYLQCMVHKVIVDENNQKEHNTCGLIGMMFDIKKPKFKIYGGLIAKQIIAKEVEKLNVEKWEKNEVKKKLKKMRGQERFKRQIPQGSQIINLSVFDRSLQE